MKIWILSDSHFFHDNMVPYCGRPVDHTEQLIANWQKTVSKEDLVIHLGDVIMGKNSAENLAVILPTLPGKKVLVRGNHDIEKQWGSDRGFLERGFDFVCDYYVYDKYAFSHCPLTPLPMQANLNWNKPVEKNIHGHFHNSTFKDQAAHEVTNRFYDRADYVANRDKYQLIHIEDTLTPYLLEDVLKGGEQK